MTSELMGEERERASKFLSTQPESYLMALSGRCIDIIRQSLMWNPNLGLYSFKWRGKNLKPSLETGARRTLLV